MKSTSIKALSIIFTTIIFGCSSEKEAAKTIPQLTTTEASSVTLTAASTGGNVSLDGGVPVTSRGVVWSTATAPTISLSTKTTDGSGSGSFSSAIANLNPSTNYYVRAYATNSVGTAYGNEITFTTGAIVLPTLTTTAITSITTNSAVSGGTISADGGGSITARGVVWGTSTSPTINLSTKTTDGTGTGTFTSAIANLTLSTNYYARAYATNSAGTAYGNEISFTTQNSMVNINGQIWKITNLDVNTYRDGTPIPQVTDINTWANLTTGAWCYYNNDSTNGAIYGKLYNWYAVAGIHDNDPNTPNKILAPTGWHVPTNAEWTSLITNLGGTTLAGGTMKSTGTSLWQSPNYWATNASGFTGLPGGSRNFDGIFSSIGLAGVWWSSTDENLTHSWNRFLNYNNSSANKGYINKKGGYSVRCVKD